MGLLPFGPDGDPDGSENFPLFSGVGYQQFYEWIFRVQIFRVDLAIAMDPETVAEGAPATALYSGWLYRDPTGFPSGEQERTMIRPGVRDEVLGGVPLPFPGNFNGLGEKIGTPFPGDDYFTSLELSAYFELCPLADNLRRYEVDREALEFIPSARLSITGSYDDGSEGAFAITTSNPALWPIPPEDIISGIGTIDGKVFDYWCVGFNPGGNATYSWGGVPPVVSITPAQWYEFRRTDGSEPIFDAATGAVNEGQTPFTNLL